MHPALWQRCLENMPLARGSLIMCEASALRSPAVGLRKPRLSLSAFRPGWTPARCGAPGYR